MKRPCHCEQVQTCALCRLYHEDSPRGARYRRAWGVPRPGDESAPSAMQQAASFGKALARHARRGFTPTSAEVQAERRATCDACEHRDAERDRCKLCRCRLSGLLNKIQMVDSVCPAGKWGKPLPPIP